MWKWIGRDHVSKYFKRLKKWRHIQHSHWTRTITINLEFQYIINICTGQQTTFLCKMQATKSAFIFSINKQYLRRKNKLTSMFFALVIFNQMSSPFRCRERNIFQPCCFPSTFSLTEFSSERPEPSIEYPFTGLNQKTNYSLQITFEVFEGFCTWNLIFLSLPKRFFFFLLRHSVKIQKIP